MFKKRIWKHILFGCIWAASLGGLVVLMSFIEFKKSSVYCKERSEEHTSELQSQ